MLDVRLDTYTGKPDMVGKLFLYGTTLMFYSFYVIVEDELIKDSQDDVTRDEIVELAKSGKSEYVITIQEGDVQRVYGPDFRLQDIKERMLKDHTKKYDELIEKGKIVFIPNKEE